MKWAHPIGVTVGRNLFVAALCLSWTADTLAAGDVNVACTVSTASVQVAEPFWLELTVTAPVGTQLTFPQLGAQLGDFDLLDTQDLFDIPGGKATDNRTWTRRLKLESIITGELEVPSLELQVVDRGQARTIATKPIPIRVASVLEDSSDPTKFRDIRSVVDVAVPQIDAPTGWAWAWTSLAGVALATVAVVMIARRKKWVTPGEWALHRLDQLENSLISSSTENQNVLADLSSILRDYLPMQFSISKPGQTAIETVRLLTVRKCVDDALSQRLGRLFEMADEAKFADLQLTPDAQRKAIKDSREIVQHLSGSDGLPTADRNDGETR